MLRNDSSSILFLSGICNTLLAFSILVTLGCGPGKKPSVARDQEDSSSNQNDDEKEKPKRQVEAKVGVGKQGRIIKDREGLFATPVKSYFKARDQLTFMNVNRALTLYEIENGYPKSHEEFMEKIIRANQLELPKLPEGDFYEFDPKKGKLMVWTSDE